MILMVVVVVVAVAAAAAVGSTCPADDLGTSSSYAIFWPAAIDQSGAI